MKYIIKMKYQTGNSFGSSMAEDPVELSWENLDIAKENLKRIKEHYLFYREWYAAWRKPDLEELKKNAEIKPWFVHRIPGGFSDDFLHNIMLKLDSGEEHQYYAGMWCGHFERLMEAEIIPEPGQDSDMFISF